MSSAIEKMDSVLGVLLPQGEDRLSPEEQALFDERQDARRRREFARADEARRKLEALAESGLAGSRQDAVCVPGDALRAAPEKGRRNLRRA